ncbi:MAG: winged helix-turn-helix transcriptional regulator [Lentisphaeria bacterium]|nr:winged helix-turn-helix transcriptional regulator [Lentisphaeria bacterium]
MPSLNPHNLYELDLLSHVEETPRLSNRQAAGKLGVSVKLAHELLKGLVSRGLLHVTVVHARRWDYFLTPKGIAEKARLTLEFLDFSMHFYREARKRGAQVCRDLAEAGCHEVILLGAGDLAEIVYLGLQEWNLTLAAVFDNKAKTFMGRRVAPLDRFAESARNAPVIVCLYDAKKPMGERFLPPGIQAGDHFHWIF